VGQQRADDVLLLRLRPGGPPGDGPADRRLPGRPGRPGRASDLFRSFREQPTPDLAQSARAGLATALSPNERLQQLYHPWTSYLIVPLFALANAGIPLSGAFLARAYTSPVTLGILIGYVAGKPIGITGASWLLTRLSRGRLRPPVGWATVAGVGFAVSILIATLAFTGTQLQEAKLGVLTTVLAAPILTWLVCRAAGLLPARLQVRALLGTTQVITDLGAPVDPARERIRGPARAPVTIVEYGDFECPYCGQAEPALRELLAGHGDVRYVWRHLPLNDVHPDAQLAAEAAADQDAFWQMHDLLLQHQDALQPRDLTRYASDLGLDSDRFAERLRKRAGAARIAEDVDTADLSDVTGTPTFFINGRRHYGSYDITALPAPSWPPKPPPPRPPTTPGKPCPPLPPRGAAHPFGTKIRVFRTGRAYSPRVTAPRPAR
jgi:protein-disulfide isomerase